MRSSIKGVLKKGEAESPPPMKVEAMDRIPLPIVLEAVMPSDEPKEASAAALVAREERLDLRGVADGRPVEAGRGGSDG